MLNDQTIQMTDAPSFRRMMMAFTFAGVLTMLPPAPAAAENRIVTTFGDTPRLCEGPSQLLREYSLATRHLLELNDKHAPVIEIQQARTAIEFAAEGLDPEQAGVTVVVEKAGPDTFTPRPPKIEINGKTSELAQVVVVGIEPDANRFHLIEPRTQMRVDFRLLGICSFVSPGAVLTRASLQTAVDSYLGN